MFDVVGLTTWLVFTHLEGVISKKKEKYFIKEMIVFQASKMLKKCAKVCEFEGTQDLFNKYSRLLVNSMKEDYVAWTTHSVDRLIFDTLLLESGKKLTHKLVILLKKYSINSNGIKIENNISS